MILFNTWKHHKKFIQNEIENFVNKGDNSFDELKEKLLQIGNSQTDLYLGNLSSEEISNEIITILQNQNLLEVEKYRNWILSSEKKFRIIYLSDNSCWTLLIGEKENSYIHIHPCRNSKFVLRISSSILKTAICAIIFAKIKNINSIDTKLINSVRKYFLNECPIKNLERSIKLKKLILILGKD